MRLNLGVGLAIALLLSALSARAEDLTKLLATVKAVGPEGAGDREAAAAWRQIAHSGPNELPMILASLDDANPLAANWIHGAVDAIAERTLAQGGKLPKKGLEQFVLETEHAPRARRLAFDWLARVDATAPDRLIPGMLDDPSIEFRRDAVSRLLDQAAPLYDSKDFDAAAPIYERALSGARDQDQIDLLSARLKEMGRPVDLARHFGFVMDWKLIGPFENTDKKGYAVAYPPELEEVVDLAASHAGKKGTVQWFDYTTKDDYGLVDLNTAIGKNMGAVGYGLAFYTSDREQEVDLRLGCINANKLWLNGELLTQHEVYHANTSLDQYICRGTLRPGRNAILIKVCQNEQTEEWAQRWQFQLRICDRAGTAILSQDRLAQTPPAGSP